MTSYGKINYINGSNIISTLAIYGLSTDTKPTVYGPYDTPIPNGSAFVEMDTSTMYLFDESNQEWDAWNPSEPHDGSDVERTTLVYRTNPTYNSLSELSDVNLIAPQSNQVLAFDATSGQWTNVTLQEETYTEPYYQGVDLTVKHAAEISASPYNGDPWAWIKARIQAADFTDIHVNDYIPFTTTNNVTLEACIAGINTYKGYGSPEVGNHIDFISRELWPTRKTMNPLNFNNGTKFDSASATEHPWLASDLYLWLNSKTGKVVSEAVVNGGTGTAVDYSQNGVYYFLPESLKNVIVEKRTYLPKRYSSSNLLSDDNAASWEDIGKLWLPSEFEVFGAPVWGGKGGYATMGNCVQYPIFANNMNRVKNRSGSRDAWWLLSVYSGNATHGCNINSYGLPSHNNTSNANMTMPVCFRVA